PLRKTEAYSVYRLEYPSPVVSDHEPNNTIPADYYLPNGIEPGAAPRPAVVCLHILNGNFELVNMLCSALAGRGIPAVMFKLPYYGERELPGGRRELLNSPKLFLESLHQGAADVRRTVDLLASRPEVDANKIGLAGISLGGLLGATTAAHEPRLNRTALILAGGDLAAIIATADEAREIREFMKKLPAEKQAEMKKVIGSIDPISHAKGLRERARQGRVLMVNGTDDRVVPKACAEKLATALGMPERVVWLQGLGHYTAMAALPRIMKTTVDFFAADMPAGAVSAGDKSSTAKGDPKRLVVALLEQAVKILEKEPKPGRCHFADLEVKVDLPDNQTGKGRLRYVRGHGDKFRLGLKINRPLNIEVEMGQDESPWIAAAGKNVFRGTKKSQIPGAEPASGNNPLSFIDEQHVLKLRMARGLVTGIALAPTLLDNFATFSEETGSNGASVLKIMPKDKKHGHATLATLDGQGTPDELKYSAKDVAGTLKFHVWQTDTIGRDELFRPPSGLPVREVARDDVYRMFSALFNFAMEMAQ
ncbi:MAG: prolyl oligopeptidase family serine peptidase, partial [Pirellulales bacterium]|nr:prolyl oligopeptidase family serine peptidase [Pirellulales bacterium]